MRTFIALFLFLFSLMGYGQDSLQHNTVAKKLILLLYGGNANNANISFPYINLIDTIPVKKKEIEVRLWFGNGSNRINITTFIVFKKLHNKWNAVYYTFSKM